MPKSITKKTTSLPPPEKNDSQPPQKYLTNPASKIALGVVVLLVLFGSYAYNRYYNIATVNGEPISRLAYYQALDKQYGQTLLANLITQKLVHRTAIDQGVTIDQSQIDTQIATITKNVESQGMTLADALAKENMTQAQLEEQIRTSLLIETLGKKDIAVTDEQIKNYLEENKDFLPEDATAEELNQLAREQLTSTQDSQAIQTWLEELRQSANIVYF